MATVQRHRLGYIDGLRALAVLAVVGYHALGIGTGQVGPAWSYLGIRGVDLFFVLSGFCLALPFLRDRRAPDYAAFVKRRLLRIVPAYYAAIALFVFVLRTAPHARPEAILREMLFLEGNGATVHNGSFWSIAVEMHWYFFAPFLIALYLRSRLAFALAGIAAYAECFLGHWYEPGLMPNFMLGIVAADVALRGGRLARMGPVLAVAATLIATSVFFATYYIDHADPTWHIASFFIVIAGARVALLEWTPLRFIGRASYSIYLVHAPCIAWLHTIGLWWPASAIGGVAAGIAFWALVELPLEPSRLRKTVRALGQALNRPLPVGAARRSGTAWDATKTNMA